MDIKEDKSSLSSVEEQILQLAKNKETGISNKDIQEAIPEVPASEWTKLINKFLKSG